MSLLKDQDAAPGTPAPRGRQYWRSLDHLEQTPQFEEFLHREFPNGASEMLSPFSRRAFLNLMGASMALAGAVTGCRRPKQLILPYSQRPEDLQPGIAQHYATSMERGGQVIGLLAESHEGRPTKLEGLPEHPSNQGGVDAMAQAAILELYDPDRLPWPTRGGTRIKAADFDAMIGELGAKVRGTRGKGLAILRQRTSSPSHLALEDQVRQALPQAAWATWEPVNSDNALLGAQIAFGRPLVANYDYQKADVVLAIENDFLASGDSHLGDARAFMRRRRQEGGAESMNRLYVAEGYFSMTGSVADHRLRVAPSQAAAFALAVLAKLGGQIAGPLASAAGAKAPAGSEGWIEAVAADLAAHRGRALIVAGPSVPAEIHAALHLVNAALGAECVALHEPADPKTEPAGSSLRTLVNALNAGQVETLVILGGNPLYDAPADLNLAGALAKAQNVIHLTMHANETSEKATWCFPRAHFLESWGDLRAADGTISMVQPLIAPLFEGRTDGELLAAIAGLAQTRSYEIVRAYHQGNQSATQFESTWRTMLHDGLVKGSARQPAQAAPQAAAIASAVGRLKTPDAPTAQSPEVLFLPDPLLYDGRYTNNGWLMETPDPSTKVTWDNCAYMSLGTSKALGVGSRVNGPADTDLVRLTVGGKQVDVPIWILPGMADNVIALHLGYGRKRAGRVGDGIGVDVYPLRTMAALHVATGAKVAKTGRSYQIACVQDHWSMENRDLVRERVVGEPVEAEDKGHAEGPEAEEYHKLLWESPYKYDKGPQWGMVIDLNSCIGCNACMVACQAENNVPIVGKRHVLEGREMHWIRIDRYFSVPEMTPEQEKDAEQASFADPGYAADSAEMVFQPMPCQQCETAPCEEVCPVGATVHSEDGLNVMVYNRCIGTRYCSNNCPFKVRRFNFFNYHEPADDLTQIATKVANNPLYTKLEDKKDQDLLWMASNPNVTVRSRGVMEKCSYCLQRIQRARMNAQQDGRRPIRDGEVVTACQQTCPTEAITFGDILDKSSKVTAKRHSAGNYTLLESLDVRPRTSYLPKLRNPNPKLKA